MRSLRLASAMVANQVPTVLKRLRTLVRNAMWIRPQPSHTPVSLTGPACSSACQRMCRIADDEQLGMVRCANVGAKLFSTASFQSYSANSTPVGPAPTTIMVSQ